jgi:Mor family transcriptional regulator
VVDLLECSAPRGLEDGAFQRLVEAIHYGMLLMYLGQKASTVPLTDHTPTRYHRNEQIRRRYQQGETVVRLAAAFGLSQQRVSQILHGKRK